MAVVFNMSQLNNPTTNTLDMMLWPRLETPLLKMNEKFKWPVLIITGFIESIWLNSIVAGCFGGEFMSTFTIMLVTLAFITHAVINLFTTAAMISGLKEKDPGFLKPWMGLKGIEIIFFIVAIIKQCTPYYRNYTIMLPVTVIFMLIGGYLLLCIYLTWKKIRNNLRLEASLYKTNILTGPIPKIHSPMNK